MNKGYDLAALGICADGVGLSSGRVAVANESAFAASFYSQPMTQYAIGWKTDNRKLENLLDFIAPSVKSPRRFEYRKGNNADQFAMIADESDVRALYGEFAQVKTIGEIVNAKTVSKGLSTVIEKDSEMAGEVEDKIKWLKRLLIRAEIYRAITLMNAAATNTAKTWGSSATPDIDVMTAIDTFGDAVGIDANRVLYGATAWQKRLASYAAQSKSGIPVPATMKDLADFLNVDEIMKSNERYTSGSGKTKFVSANKVYVFQGERNGSREDASSLKRFWTPEQGGGEWAVYIDDVTNAKVKKITVAHTSQIAVVNSAGIQSLTIS